jgi:hypothetical protein
MHKGSQRKRVSSHLSIGFFVFFSALSVLVVKKPKSFVKDFRPSSKIFAFRQRFSPFVKFFKNRHLTCGSGSPYLCIMKLQEREMIFSKNCSPENSEHKTSHAEVLNKEK